ncbi:hypothetical protein BJY52DRAFT_1238730 [Lactarius psammicola]|nr:hypothetical protein BJY52DRAFT_1238730 [Lactarius psammicola]
MVHMNEKEMVLIYLPAYTVTTQGTGSTGYFSLLKAMAPSEIDVLEETETGGRLFGTVVLVLVSVVACTPNGTLSWVNVTTPFDPSSDSRRLSREFRLGHDVGSRED